MVTILRRSGWPAAWLLPMLLATGWLCLAAPARAESGTVVFFTYKQGVQNADGSGDSLFKTLEKDHGAVKEDRSVVLQAVELDFYSATSRNAGLAVGAEIQEYSKQFHFRTSDPTKTNEDMKMSGRAFLFTLMGFLRWGRVLPYVGVGSGNYYVEYHQSTEKISLLDSATSVLNVRAGFRVLLGRWGLLLEAGDTAAPLKIHTQSGNSTLNLGGTYLTGGLSYAW